MHYENIHSRAVSLVMRFADEKFQAVDLSSLSGFRLADIGYDSLSIAELAIAVEQELEDCGITTEVDDDSWDHSLSVTKVIRDVETLLEGRDIR